MLLKNIKIKGIKKSVDIDNIAVLGLGEADISFCESASVGMGRIKIYKTNIIN